MFWFLIGFPLIFMIIVIVIALLIGKRDRKKQLQQIEENKKNLLKSNPKQAVYEFIDQNKKFFEYLFNSFSLKNKQGNDIDILYFSRKGLFMISVVGVDGSIVGDSNSDLWINKNRDEYAIKNPLYEKEELLLTLGNIIGDNQHLHHLVVCPNADISGISANDGSIVVMSELFPSINKLDDLFSDNDLMIYYNAVNNYLNRQEDKE